METATDRPRYSTVTELPVNRASGEQIKRLYARYRFASGYCAGKDVLEVACGAGLGLGYLARRARRVVGVDIDEENLRYAAETYKGRDNIKTRLLDAHDLLFRSGSFDVVVLFEAIYYFEDPERLVCEARRVMRDEGALIVCTANREWPGFNPSPYSHRYFSARELYNMLGRNRFDVELFGDSPAPEETLAGKAAVIAKVLAVKLGLMPKTMKGKEALRRVFQGRLMPLPPEVGEGMAEYIPPARIPSDAPDTRHRVIFAVARKHRGPA